MRRHIFGILRVSGLVLGLLAVLLYVDYRVARAAVFERLLGLGQRMAPYLDSSSSTEPPRMVRLNGVNFMLAAGHTSHSQQMVRRFYRDRYSGKQNGLGDLTAELEARHALPAGIPAYEPVEFGDEERGGVAAIDFGPNKLTFKDLIARFHRLMATGDLGEVGRLRYCYTERDAQGGTRFLTIWTDGKFNLRQLIPPGGKGDTPGSDIEGIPRYPGTWRILSSGEAGMPQSMVIYEGVGSPETAIMFYRGRMATLGWSEEPTFAKIAANQKAQGLHFVRQGHEAFLSFSDRAAGQGVSIVALQMR